MNKIEKLRKIINESYCQECDKFGLCEYCEPKQTLVDIEAVLSIYEYLLISNRNNIDYENKVKKATEAYKRLVESEEIKVRTADRISKENLLKYEELKILSIVKKYPEELGMILQCKDYKEYELTFYIAGIDCGPEISEEQFNLIKNFFTKKEPEIKISTADTVDHSKPMSTIDDTIDPNKPISVSKEIIIEEPPMDRCCVDDGRGLFSNYRCPNCGESYFSIDYTTSTLMYCPTIIKDGKVVSHDGNTTTEVCTCHNCHKKFFISHRDGKTIITGEE